MFKGAAAENASCFDSVSIIQANRSREIFLAAEKSCAFPPPCQIVAFPSRERSFHNKWQKTDLSFYFYFNSTLFASTQIVEPHKTARCLVRQTMRVSSSSSCSSFSCYAVVGS